MEKMITLEEHKTISHALTIINQDVLWGLSKKYPTIEERLKSPEAKAFKLAITLSEQMEAVMFNNNPEEARLIVYYGTRWDEVIK